MDWAEVERKLMVVVRTPERPRRLAVVMKKPFCVMPDHAAVVGTGSVE